MALDLMDEKVRALRYFCLEPLDDLIVEAAAQNMTVVEKGRLDEVLCIYYPIAMYRVIETNIFGRLPVYLVAPNFDLLFDTEALKHVDVPRDMDGRPVLNGRSNV